MQSDWLGLLRQPRFRQFFLTRVAGSLAGRFLFTGIAWQVFHQTRDPFASGVLGLVEIIPVLAFALVAGHVCDRYDRRAIAVITRLGMLIASVMLLVFAILKLPVSLVLLAVGILATIRTFYSPAIDNLLPRVVDEKHYREAVSWLSLGWQSASVIGPVLAGIIIGSGGHVWRVYIIEIVLGLVTAYGYAQLPKVAPEPPQETDEQGWRSALEGFSFLKTRPALLAAISLDLFAVLLGGAAALLPAFADTVLKVGPVGLGWLQASVNIGALMMSAYLARQPEMKQAGPAMLWAVGGFGVATIGFALSTNIWLSALCLFTLGALDAISVVIRSTMLLVQVPNRMRGRVSAFNDLFVGASNELGGFESGLMARWLGLIRSVALGGVMTLIVVAGTAVWVPSLRNLKRMEGTSGTDLTTDEAV